MNTKVPVQAEAEAFLWAVQLASQMYFKKVIIEGDSENCVEVVTNSSVSVHWRIANFVDEVRLLSVSFDKLEFMWVYGNAYEAAHVLAKLSLSNSCPSYFVDGLGPSLFVNVISKEEQPRCG